MTIQDILSKCDHTLLATTCTWNEIRDLCDDGIRFHTASVCIPPSYVKRAKEYVGDRLPICTVIGFPNGYQTSEVKAFETACAVKDGADEIDMVIDIGMLKDKNYDGLLSQIQAVRKACPQQILKVIIETCLLTDEEILKMCDIVVEAGADYIKSSTGFSTAGATPHAVALMKQGVGDRAKVKAAGGISSIKDAEEFLSLGADRLGTSRIVRIYKETDTAS